MITDRGVIKHVDRAQQINDFRELIFGKITPTDIDGLIEYKDKAYVIIEVKYGQKELPHGQRLAIKRMMDDLSVKKHTLAIVCEHIIHDTAEQVNVAECKVREVYFGHQHERKWRSPNEEITVRTAIENFLTFVDATEYRGA